MKIKTINITGFRSIKNTIEIDFPQICALIGANNTGKSNILTAIYKVLGRDWVTVNNFDNSDVYFEEFDKDIIIDIEFEEPYNYFAYVNADPTPIPRIKFTYTRYKIGENKGQRRLEKECLNDKGEQVFILAEKPKRGQANKYKPLTTIPQDMQENIPVIFIGTDRNLKNQLPNARNSLLGSLMNDINKDFLKHDNTIEVQNFDGSSTTTPRSERFIYCINEAINSLKTDAFLALEKAIKVNALHQLGFDTITDSNKLDIYFNPLTSLEFYKSLEIWVNEYGFNVNATELGAGFQNAIVISILKAFEERRKQGAIFLIEEPEMFLHPQMQRSLYKTLKKIGETNQVIYVTHSPNFVTIPEFDEIRIVRKNTDGTFITQSSIEPTLRLKEKFRKELDPERNELFFAQRILFVEGDTEKLAFPEYAKRLDIDFDNIGTAIIEVGGKRNLIDFIELAISFGIHTGVIYDTDSSDFSNNREDEVSFNEALEAYTGKMVKVWHFEKNYEEQLKLAWGEANYSSYCSKYEKTSKAIRARLFAADIAISVPDFVVPIIHWAGNKE